MNTTEESLDYSRPVQIAEGIYWVGFHDLQSGLHCNPYLVVEGSEAVVIDGGSRPDFPSVMLKILSTGCEPSAIEALIYQHHDPDLCGSIPHFEDIIDRPDLKIIADKSSHMFIRHYAVSSKLFSLADYSNGFRFATGRELRFIPTPYAHTEGSFATFDSKTKVLFTSDLFGSYGFKWDLYLKLDRQCAACTDHSRCPNHKAYCPLPDLLGFHQHVFHSTRILRYALRQLADIRFSIIAPQHGSIIKDADSIAIVRDKLASLEAVGIDRIIGNRSSCRLTGKPQP